MIAVVDPVEIGSYTPDPVARYCNEVLGGERLASRKIKRACRRHLLDLKRSLEDPTFPYYYDPEAAARPVRFASRLKHWEGEWAGQFFVPEPWQVFIFGSIYGWKRRSDGCRRFRYAYVEVPRKNGKSFLASVVALYMLVADGEEGAQVYSAATKKDQAKIVWDAACKIAQKSGIRQTSLHWNSLRVKATNSRFEPLASDSKRLDGLNPHCAVLDELHEWPDRGLWDVIEDAFGARTQPLMFVITTAGFNRDSICYQQRSHGVSILESVNGSYVDDTYFVYIADVDEEDLDKWKEEVVWFKSNPCLGAAKKIDYIRDLCNKARLMPQKENAFKNKQLDIWTEAEVRWLDMERWDLCGKPIDRARLSRRHCFSGLDLSSIQDLTANVLLFPPGPYPEWTILPHFYLPKDNLEKRERADKVPYSKWVREGFITLTPGEIIDLSFVKRDMLRLKEEFNIVEVGFDPWKAVEIATSLQGEGMKMVQMRQGHGTLGAPTTDLELKHLRGELRHGGNPVLRWMARNSAVIKDSNDNIRPDKKHSGQRIDGIVATIMALGRALVSPVKVSKYETEGLMVVGNRNAAPTKAPSAPARAPKSTDAREDD